MPSIRRSKPSFNGFTLVELLVVIGMIAVLIGVLLPVLSRARKSAQEIKSLGNLRQMLIGYTAYHLENRGQVLWGYPTSPVNGVTVVAYDPVSMHTITGQPALRYPWRLLRYCSNVWPILHSHATVPPLPQKGDSAAVVFGKAYTLSLDPTYGLNSVFVGGDYRFHGFDNNRTNVGKSVVFRANEVHRPTELIVFADCQASLDLSGSGGEAVGYAYLTPPRAGGVVRWTVVKGQAVSTGGPSGEITGVPHGWYTQRVMTGFFDGHAEALPPDRLTDMRLWANQATTPDYDDVP